MKGDRKVKFLLFLHFIELKVGMATSKGIEFGTDSLKRERSLHK